MATPELLQSWARTEALLREARAALPLEVVDRFAADLKLFDEFLAHNELGLAFDYLDGVVNQANCASPALVRPLLLTAQNMGRLPDSKSADRTAKA